MVSGECRVFTETLRFVQNDEIPGLRKDLNDRKSVNVALLSLIHFEGIALRGGLSWRAL